MEAHLAEVMQNLNPFTADMLAMDMKDVKTKYGAEAAIAQTKDACVVCLYLMS